MRGSVFFYTLFEIMHRKDLQIIANNSNLQEEDINKILTSEFCSTTSQWQNFLSLLLLVLGICSTLSGIVFFFAYNWDYMSDNIKLVLAQSSIVLSTILSILPIFKLRIRKLFLFSSAILVGVALAVYGQIYQVSAEQYQFFLTWALYILLWSIVSNSAPLWLLNIILFNMALFLYCGQQYHDNYLPCVFFNFIVFLGFYLAAKKLNIIPLWFVNTILILLYFSLFISKLNLLEESIDYILIAILLFINVVIFVLGQLAKNTFYIGLSLLSIITVCLLWFNITVMQYNIVHEDYFNALLIANVILIVTSISMSIKYLLTLSKKWHYEN